MAESPELKPVYLLTGSDRPKIETALARLRRHFQPEAVELSPRGRSGADSAALCNAGSLFGDARLIVVDGVDGRRNADGRLVNGWKAADVKALQAYLASPAPGTVLALVAEELKKDAPLTKACAKAGDVLVFEVPKRNVAPGWPSDSASPGAAQSPRRRALVQLVGDDIQSSRTRSTSSRPGRRGADRRARGRALVAARCRDADVRAHRRVGQRDTARTLEASETIFEREAVAARHGAAARRHAG